MIKTGLKVNKQHKQFKGYTFVEVLVSLAIISLAFVSAMNIIFTMYRANIFITYMLAIDSEAVYVRGILQKILRSADPKTIDCNRVTTRDYNGDGNNDIRLLDFRLLNGDRYNIVLLQDRNNPILRGKMFNQLVLVRYNDGLGDYEIINALSSPLDNVRAQNIECTSLVEVPERGYSVRGITLEFTLDSTVSFQQVFGVKKATPLVSDYKLIVSAAVIN